MLYHVVMGRRALARAFAFGLLIVSIPGLAGSAEPDRLERFRQLATSRLSVLELSGPESPTDLLQEIYALLDDEILESLEAGGVFASEGFLQDRLDAFRDAWGGSAFRILNLRGGDLLVGSFQLFPGPWGNSIRVYRRVGARAELLAAIQRAGAPQLFPMPPTRAGREQFLVIWVGPLSSRRTLALRIELWRREGDRFRAVWSTADLFGADLYAVGYELRGLEIVVRYEAHYEGWQPGCEGQTEHEDRFRYVSAGETFELAGRSVHNGWHRELHATVGRLLAALRAGDQRTLSALGLTPELRRKLPGRLDLEPACDIWDQPLPRVVTVSAIVPGDGRPWGLRFRHTPRGWRLAGAEPLP